MPLVFRRFRILSRHWKLSAIAVFSLSIAMGLGTLSLSLTNTFLLLPPAGAAPDRLVMIHSRLPGTAIDQLSYPDYQYYRENNHVFTDIAAAPNSINVNTTSEGGVEIKVVARPVSANYFSVMGLRPYLGSFFSPGTDLAKTPIAVLTYTGWRRLGSDPKIVGKQVTKYTIIGVAPPEFTGSFFGLNGDMLTPLATTEDDASWFSRRDVRSLFLIARLKPSISKEQAQAEVSTLARQLTTAYPKDNKDLEAVVTRATMLPPDAIPDARLAFGILLAVVMLVLLIACANVANLLLAIAVTRRQEAAIKLALGAQRGRLIREFLRESTVICAASAGLGYVLASHIITRYADVSMSLPGLGTYSIALDLRLDGTVIALTVGLMLIAVLATGLAPALYASSPNLAQILCGEIVVGGTRNNARRNILVIAQVAVCTAVLVGMGLCQRSLYNLRQIDPGFSARNLLFATVYPQKDETEAQRQASTRRMAETVAALPGVESVAFSQSLPFGLGYGADPIPLPNSDKKVSVFGTAVDENYFSTMGMVIQRGRTFNSGDRAGSNEVVIVNRTMAEMFWPGEEAVGKVVMVGDPLRKVLVVGEAADSKIENLDEASKPILYYALAQHDGGAKTVVVRTEGKPGLWVQPIQQTMRAMGLVLPFPPVTFDDLLNFSLIVERIASGCVAVLSGLSVLLAVLGLFGAISYSVSGRKKELGIRVALGARNSELYRLILSQTLKITSIGAAIGLGLGIAATVVLRSMFYGIHSLEWSVLVPVAVFMMALSLLVAYVSARPWIRIDPMESVRHA